MSASPAEPRLSKPVAVALTVLIGAVAVAIRAAIPDDGAAWEIADIVVFAVSIVAVLSVWQRAGFVRQRRSRR